MEMAVGGEQTTLVPSGVSARPEEIGAHVVVHAMHLPTELAEVGDHFRADESGGTGDEEGH